METLYPPYIEEKLPAQIQGSNLLIPFEYNKAVSSNSVESFTVKIKTISTNILIYEIENIEKPEDNILKIVSSDNFEKLKIGQYYKIQIACKGETLGYFSNVGTFKYTVEPVLDILIDNLPFEVIGIYSQAEGDKTEKIYSYSFDIYDIDNNILFASSGDKIHNNNEDSNIDFSLVKWTLDKRLNNNVNYLINFNITTTNNYNKQISKNYNIFSNELKLQGSFLIENNFDEGFIHLHYDSQYDNQLINQYAIYRADSKDNFQSWYKIAEEKIYDDYFIEQGVTYRYDIYGLSNNFYYGNLDSELKHYDIYADYEYIFLYGNDGKQLKIKYNPKISSFRTVLQETKTETIGGKYPFFFKNGNIEYKELPLSGLISYLMDDEEKFIQKNILGLEKQQKITQLSSENIYAERIFRNSVLNWLNNGEIKLLKSPTEGNYLVRIINVSLTPNDTLGRMIHNFNCNAYEIAEYNLPNLKKYNFIKTKG